MSYTSPFGDIAANHDNGVDALCLSRTHCSDAIEETLAEFHRAAVAAIESHAPQPAFFLARHVAELGLKALHSPDFPPGHDLVRLLDSLGQRGDDLITNGGEQELIVAFIRDLARHDVGGDQGRYPTTRTGALALATLCCADPAGLREHIDRLHDYIHRRLAA